MTASTSDSDDFRARQAQVFDQFKPMSFNSKTSRSTNISKTAANVSKIVKFSQAALCAIVAGIAITASSQSRAIEDIKLQ